MTSTVVAPCSRDAAKFAILNWHYSETMPAGKLVTHGVWERDSFIGAVVYGRGASSTIGSPYGLDQTEICELVRVAMRDHEAPVSHVLSRSLKMLREGNPGLRLVVSFADEKQGHVGGIYQATNWIYLGESYHSYIRLHGKIHHDRSVGAKYGTRAIDWLREHVDPDAEWVEMPPKHRYVMPLDRGMRRTLEGQAQPYPKAEDDE